MFSSITDSGFRNEPVLDQVTLEEIEGALYLLEGVKTHVRAYGEITHTSKDPCYSGMIENICVSIDNAGTIIRSATVGKKQKGKKLSSDETSEQE